jgi:hypothetical protein
VQESQRRQEVKRHVVISLAVFSAVACGLSQSATAQQAQITSSEARFAEEAAAAGAEPQAGSAIVWLQRQGFDVKGLAPSKPGRLQLAPVAGPIVSTRTAIVNQWVNSAGAISNLGIAENPAYIGSTDVCARPARFDSPQAFDPAWRNPAKALQNGVVEAYRIDTGLLQGERTIDIQFTGAFTLSGGFPGLGCLTDACQTTYTIATPDIIGTLCEVWAGSNGTTYSRVGYCNQMDILPSVWNQGLRSKTDITPPYDGGASTGGLRSRNAVSAGLGTYYRIRVGYYTFGANTATGSRVCDSMLTVAND